MKTKDPNAMLVSTLRKEMDKRRKIDRHHFTSLAKDIGVSKRSIFRAYAGHTGWTAKRILEHYGYTVQPPVRFDIRNPVQNVFIRARQQKGKNSVIRIEVMDLRGETVSVYSITPERLSVILELHTDKTERRA